MSKPKKRRMSIPHRLAQMLLDTRETSARVWHLSDLPPAVHVTCATVEHSIGKCLQACGWDVYFDPNDGKCKLTLLHGWTMPKEKHD